MSKEKICSTHIYIKTNYLFGYFIFTIYKKHYSTIKLIEINAQWNMENRATLASEILNFHIFNLQVLFLTS